jgi:hypothetical protein
MERAVAKAADRIVALAAERDKYEAAWMTAEGRLADAEADNARLREVLDDMRLLVPRAMKTIMYQGRDGLLLADEIHKADDKARAALNTGKAVSHEVS